MEEIKTYKLWINGEWVEAKSGKSAEGLKPAK